MKCLAIIFIFLFSFFQNSSAGPVEPPVHAKKIFISIESQMQDSLSCIIPFSRAGNLILIRGKADTTEGNFILDTGAPNLVLNMTYFRNYPTIAAPHDIDPGGITGSVSASAFTIIEKFSFGPIEYEQLTADRINLGHIENSKGIKILGLLGVQLFRQFEMIIDYDNSLLHLHRIAKKEERTYRHEQLRDTAQYSIFPITIMNDKILLYAQMAGKKLTMIVDSGAESNVLDSRLPNKIFDNVSISRRVMISGTGNQKVEALYGDMTNMSIGKKKLDTLPVLITNLEKMCFAYDQCLDGILGFDFLSLHKIGFNFVTRKMYIWK